MKADAQDELAKNAQRGTYRVAEVREHWARLGQFRHAHIAVGAGVHQMIQHSPYVFTRSYNQNGVRDAYSGTSAVVAGGMVQFPAQNAVVLISY